MNILGINAYHADVSAVLIRDGELAAAVEEERFARVKHVAGFPERAIRKCLEIGDIGPEQIDHFAVSRNPRANIARKAWYILSHRPSLGIIRRRAGNQGLVAQLPGKVAEFLDLDPGYVRARFHWVEHHPAHLASTFFVSPFQNAAVCAIDGFGDFVSTSFAVGRMNTIEHLGRVYFPHSLGVFYLALTQYLGFMNYGDEFKVMGLAPYGEPDFAGKLRQLVHLKEDGLFELDLSYFRHWSRGDEMSFAGGVPQIGPVYTTKLEELLGPARKPADDLLPRHEAIAASLQIVFEEAAFHLLNALYRRTRLHNLCLAGGCAMNSVANGKIRANTPFEQVYVQPAASDNGTALGAAFHVWNQQLNRARTFVMGHSLWGPRFEAEEIERALKNESGKWKEESGERKEESGNGPRVTGHEVSVRSGRQADSPGGTIQIEKFDNDEELCRRTAKAISEGLIVGWFQGRMEWGARALGNRSIVADARRKDMRDIINSKIKFREKFRPFAPSILEEAIDEYFEGAVPDPFMVQVYPVRKDKRDVIPAVTHVDGSGRLQSVSRSQNPLYWLLIKTFEELTGVPVVLNTSFNENEPIVHRPEEALDCFLRTDMDVLVMGRHFISKV